MFGLSHRVALEGSLSCVQMCQHDLLSSSVIEQGMSKERLQLRMLLTIQSLIWFHIIFFLFPSRICWVCLPLSSVSNKHIFKIVIISALRLLLTGAGSIQLYAELLTVLRTVFALDIFVQVSWAPQWGAPSSRVCINFHEMHLYWLSPSLWQLLIKKRHLKLPLWLGDFLHVCLANKGSTKGIRLLCVLTTWLFKYPLNFLCLLNYFWVI